MPDAPNTMPMSFHALHALLHERDVVVRVNEPTLNMMRRVLREDFIKHWPIGKMFKTPKNECIACVNGYDPFHCQPTKEDRK